MHFRNPFSTDGDTVSSRLKILAEDIAHNANIVSEHFSSNKLPQPSDQLGDFSDYPTNLPDEVQEARNNLRTASIAMEALAAGPKEDIMWQVWAYHDIAALQFIHHFRVAEAIPLTGKKSYTEVAATTGVDERQLKRVVRYAMLNRIFEEPEPGYVAHTLASRLLVTSDHVNAWVGYRTEETAPAALKLVAATERWGGNFQEREETPFGLAHTDGKMSRFDWLSLPENEDKQRRFATLMRALQNHEGWKLDHVVSGFHWAKLKHDAVVVDIGGSTGAVAMTLAKAFPNLRFVVEDLPAVVAKAKEAVPAELANRIEFKEYNFFEQVQPVSDAAVYFMRFIPHDWSDKYAAKLLGNTAKIMKPGQTMIIVDSVMPAPNTVPRAIERQMRRMDMEMMTQFGALEREAEDWAEVLKQADSRLEIKSINKPPGSVMSVIEVVVGTENLKIQKRFEALPPDRRGSLLYAETEGMAYGRKDSVSFANVVGVA